MIDHLLGIAMIGRYEKNVAGLIGCLRDGSDSRIRCRDGLDSRIVYTCVTDLRTL